MAKLVYLILIIVSFTLWLYLVHQFAPTLKSKGDIKSQLKFPKDLKELQEVAASLQEYSVNHWWYVFLLFSSAYVYKQSFCIPGSLFLNLLAGALYGHIGGILFACLFTGIGATVCYFLSLQFGKELVHKYFFKKFSIFQEKVQENKDNLFYFMLIIRIVPIAPGWMINIIAPLVGVPVLTFFVTTIFGLIPYNFVGVSAGGMLSSLESVNDIFTWKVFFYISVLALVAGGPAYVLNRRKHFEKIKSI